MTAAEPYTMSDLEIARGVVLDRYPPLPPPRPGPSDRAPDPRGVLEELLTDALQQRPCVVAFSGGRDSSALLAVATAVARREGLPDPLPVTRRFPDLAETDEDAWQEQVVRHLGLGDWVRIDLDDDALDLIGPAARPRLEEHGVLWPPLGHSDAPILEVAAGGAIVDGEGGDQVFGLSLHRIEPVAKALRGRRPGWRRIARAGIAAAPSTIRRQRLARRVRESGITWLRPGVQDALTAELTRELAALPLRWDRSIRQLPLHRARTEALHNRALFARDHDVDYHHPFLDPRFLDALAGLGGWRGLGTRSEGMGRLFGDVLPEQVLHRTTKAVFNRTMFGRSSQALAETWDGRGVDHSLVDPAALRQAWRADKPHARSFPLLQRVWLVEHGSEEVVGNA